MRIQITYLACEALWKCEINIHTFAIVIVLFIIIDLIHVLILEHIYMQPRPIHANEQDSYREIGFTSIRAYMEL